jgi:hypothetical protein
MQQETSIGRSISLSDNRLLQQPRYRVDMPSVHWPVILAAEHYMFRGDRYLRLKSRLILRVCLLHVQTHFPFLGKVITGLTG